MKNVIDMKKKICKEIWNEKNTIQKLLSPAGFLFGGKTSENFIGEYWIT